MWCVVLAMDRGIVACKGRLSCLRRSFLTGVSCPARNPIIWCFVQVQSARDVHVGTCTF